MILDTTTIATLVGLFIILSPGLLVTIPVLGDSDLTSLQVGYPATAGADNDATQCTTALGQGATPKTSCKKAIQLWNSGYTTALAVFVHAIVFAVLLIWLPQLTSLGLPMFRTEHVLLLTVLFGVLSPGMFLTLPALSKEDCGRGDGKKNIFDGESPDGNFCNKSGLVYGAATPKCNACTSIWMSGQTSVPSVLIHGVVFGVLVYFVAQRF